MATYTNAELVAQLYIGFYDRAPDPVGLNYWIGRLDAGVSVQDVGDSFAASPEAADTYPYIKFPNLFTPDQFLEQVYDNVFGRPIDPDGKAYYLARIESGESLGSVVASILGNAATNEGSEDQAYLQNKVDAGLHWAGLAASGDINIYQENGRLTADADASAHGVIDLITADPASVDAANEASDAFFGGGTPGASFALTAGTDFANDSISFINGTIATDFKFTNANETVIALAGTLNPTDVLMDSSTTDHDVLDLRTNGANPLSGIAGATVQNIEHVNVTAAADAGGALDLSAVFSGGKTLSIAGTLAAAGGGLQLSNYVAAGFTQFDFSGITTTGVDGGVTLTPGAASSVGVTITGGAGDDVLSGTAGDDVISGGAGNDVINGGAGNNILNGGAGDDTITATSGNNVIDGGAGNDTVTVTHGDNLIDLGAGAGAQGVTAGNGDNDISATGATGTVGVNVGNGDNTITLGDSADTIVAGNGNNTISTGAGIDNITVGNGNNTIDAGGGADIIVAGNGSNVILGGAGNDTITVGNGAVGAGDNTITGGAGSDTINIINGTQDGAQSIFVGAGDTGVTNADADIITGFTTARDMLHLGGPEGNGGPGGNYVVLDDVAADVTNAVAAAAASLTGGVHYVLVNDVTNGGADSFLVFDLDGDGNADGAISLVGVNDTQFAATDIFA